MSDIFTIAANLATQDSRMTSNPIFIVQQKERQFPGDPDADDPYYWVNEDWDEVNEEVAKILDEMDRDGVDEVNDDDGSLLEMSDYSKVYYRDVYRFVQPFFTEAGAKRYIEINGHNLREPRIYVEGGYRNEEWETIREWLLALGAVQDKRSMAQVIEEAKAKELGHILPTNGLSLILPGKTILFPCWLLKTDGRWARCVSGEEYAANKAFYTATYCYPDQATIPDIQPT